jgi:hypothetical protein
LANTWSTSKSSSWTTIQQTTRPRWLQDWGIAGCALSIKHYRLDAERATSTGLDRSATEMLSQQLNGTDPSEVLYALRVLGAGSYHAMHPAVRGLLTHPSEEVRREAIRVLDEAGDTAAHGAVEKALYDEDLHVRTQALLYVAHHTQIDPLDRIEQLGEFKDFSIRAAMITFLAQPGTHENLDAARLLLIACCRTTRRRRSWRRRGCWSSCPTSSRIRSGLCSPRA